MASITRQKTDVLAQTIVPHNGMVLVKKDANRTVTKGGIALPDSHEIGVLTGRVLAVAEDTRRCLGLDEGETLSIRELDKIIIQPGSARMVDMEDESMFLIPYTDIIGVIKKTAKPGEG